MLQLLIIKSACFYYLGVLSQTGLREALWTYEIVWFLRAIGHMQFELVTVTYWF